jgi:glutamyl-Q tRNA(Asp) synthetase
MEHLYRGRFAPSPTGPLHFGSLVAAVGSYLAAKHHQGIWLVRMEDLDTPRCVPGAAEDILRTLAMFGLHSDEPVLYQSHRTAAYEQALRQLQDLGAVYPCCCTRKEIADSALHGIEGLVYPGTCRNGVPPGREGRAWRVRTNNESIEFDDALQGGSPDTERESDGCGRGSQAAAPANGCSAVTCRSRITQHLEREIGDFVVKRADGLFAYQLAVVVDDAHQGITHIVRGADLQTSTARQIYLQRLLGLRTPAYMHLPVAVNAAGEKLSKQTLATPVDTAQPVATLLRVLDFLRQQPPAELAHASLEAVWDWAIRNWDESRLRGVSSLPAL